MAYCLVTDLLTGNIPVAANLNAQKFVDDSADEIDSKIGFRYQTPVATSEERPVLLLLKRINVHLATGRLIMAADAGGQQDNVHSYGARLVREAISTLNDIADGTLLLPITVDPSLPPKSQSKPLISNLDSVSQVEAFYDAATNPSFTALFGSPYRPAGG